LEVTPLTGVDVATFTHAGGVEPADRFTAQIDWGDGISSPGKVTQAGDTYTVRGSHTYTDEGHFRISVEVGDDGTRTSLTATATLLEELLPDGTRGTPNQRFISEVYRDLLGRQSDLPGLLDWSGLLDAGQSRLEVVRMIQNDDGNEYRFHLMDHLYQQFLHRSAVGDAGVAGWVAFLRNGATVEQVEAGIIGSPEYLHHRTEASSSDGWLGAFYSDAFQRKADAAGLAAWAAFAAGKSVDDVALAIFTSGSPGLPANEYRMDVVDAFYQQYLDRSAVPDPQSRGWMARLQAGARYEEIVAEIISDAHLTEFYNKTVP
jgi:hypothetical protein